MTDKYIRARADVVVSTNSDYSRANPDFGWEMSFSQKDAAPFQPVALSTTAHTITTSHATAGFCLGVFNEEASGGDNIELTVHVPLGSQAAVTHFGFADANPDTITDNNTGSTFVTNGARIGGYVRVDGSENSGENDSTFLIQATTTDVLTLATGEALTANTDDESATLYFQARQQHIIQPQEWCLIGVFEPANNIVLKAVTNTAVAQVFYCIE